MIYDGDNKYNNTVVVILINTLLNISFICIETENDYGDVYTLIYDGAVINLVYIV